MKIEPLTFRKKLAFEITRHIEQLKVKEHSLKQLFWECTLRCNLNCRHCGSDCRRDSGISDMPKEVFMRVLDCVAEKNNPNKVFVVITGGEPLMRGDLEECGKEIYQKGFPWGIVTNGLFLTAERFQSLLNAGMHSATVSLDGLASEHNWMRRNSKSYDCAVNAIRLMVGVPDFVFDVVTCVNKSNIANLKLLKDLLIELGVKRWRIFTIVPMGRAAQDKDLQLSGDEFRLVMDFIRKTRKEGLIHLNYGCEGFLGNYEGEVRDNLFACQAGITVGSVLVDGSISACSSIRSKFHQGNIYRDHFMDVWENCFQTYRNRDWMRKGECASCKYFRYCRGNGMHLRDNNGELYFCHLKRLNS